MAYLGRDRRIHTIYLTCHREYHTRDSVCVAVRDRRFGVWIPDHESVGMRLLPPPPNTMREGRSLHFVSATAQVETSKVREILRPGRATVDTYNLVLALSPTSLAG